ncbi:class I SAM-dependent methyltransferase [Streptomyces sp. P38-E01]|uniref:Class I SAM-dependent methyltransferase n=1 Tax=Streptomyces tardus TaxID=2780544 RepID=A0A949JEF4_9ACTN|nr:class I SAM-dependent methyltransferase [Streptomyces tardus]MBU7598568.1 class I SAM-dependent methyltransferase [Streptomyces tardus]
MTLTDPPRLSRLTFHGPLSETRAAGLVDRLVRNGPATILDIGCGWGELTLRLLEAQPTATAVGVDLNAEDLARGRRNAEARGLADRADFVEGNAAELPGAAADLVLCLGAAQALTDNAPPHTADALRVLRGLVAPGGRVLLGEGFWERPPTADELAAMWPGASAEEHHDLATLAELAEEAGFRVEWIETANRDEWEEFESRYQSDVEVWLAAHHDHPEAAGTRERVRRHRSSWLRGYRGVLGLAYLTLVPVD